SGPARLELRGGSDARLPRDPVRTAVRISRGERNIGAHQGRGEDGPLSPPVRPSAARRAQIAVLRTGAAPRGEPDGRIGSAALHPPQARLVAAAGGVARRCGGSPRLVPPALSGSTDASLAGVHDGASGGAAGPRGPGPAQALPVHGTGSRETHGGAVRLARVAQTAREAAASAPGRNRSAPDRARR